MTSPRTFAIASGPDVSSIAITDSDFDVAEARGCRALRRSRRLHRLALAAIRRAPCDPALRIADRIARSPKGRRHAGVCRILQHARLLAVLDLIADLASELEVEPLVVDRPRAIAFHIDAAAHVADELLFRRVSRLEVDVPDADHRQAAPVFRSHDAADRHLRDMRGIAAGHVADEDAFADEIDRLRRRAFVVVAVRRERERARHVANDVDAMVAVPERAELVERRERRAGEVRLPAHDAVELERMADRFVDLQRDLIAGKHDIHPAARALIGGEKRHRFFADAPRVLEQLRFADDLVPAGLIEAACAGEDAILRVAVTDRECVDRAAALEYGLLDHAPFGARVGLIRAPDVDPRFADRHAFVRSYLFFDIE